MNSIQMLVRVTRYDIRLNVMNSDCSLQVSERLIMVKESEWECRTPVGPYRIFLCQIWFKVCWCKAIALASYVTLWVLNVVSMHLMN